MNPQPKRPPRASWWIVTLIPVLVCVEAACSFKSLDYLKSGDNRDAQARDLAGGSTLTPDSLGPGPRVDGPAPDEALSAIDGADAGMGSPDTGGTGPGSDAEDGKDGSGNGGASGRFDARGDVPIISTGRDASGGKGGASTGGIGGVPKTSSTGGKGGTTATAGSAGTLQTGGGGAAGSTSVAGGSVAPGGTGGTGGQATVGSSSEGALTPDAGLNASDTPVATRTALLVVGSTNLNTGDAAIKSHLVGRGIAVTVVSDDGIPSSVTQNIILITRTILSANVGSTFKTSTKPVMVWEPELYDNMGMIDGSSASKGNSSSFTTLDLSSTAGALAAGLSGSVTVASTAVEVSWGVPNANAIKIASLPGASTRWPIFAYDTGAQMPGLTAPARRAGFFFSPTSAAYMTANGWLLFDTLMDWLAP